MKVKPLLTEKSLADAKKGWYTFKISENLDKSEIKKLINRLFGVHTTKLRTANYHSSQKRSLSGKTKTVTGYKKAIVKLSENEKIDIFRSGDKK